MKKIVILIVVAALVVTVYALMTSGKAIEVKTIRAEQGPLAASIRATGKIVAGQESELGSEVAGQVVRVHAVVGQRVPAAFALAELESSEIDGRLRVARARSAEVGTALATAIKRAQALKQIWQAGGESQANVDQAQTLVNELRARYSSAAADKDTAQTLRSKLTLRAPYAGVITAADIRVGETATPGKILFSLADTSRNEIEANVDQGDAAQIQLGQEVAVSSDAFPGRSWNERVLRINPALSRTDSASTVAIRLSLGPAAPPLRLGQQVDAKIRTAFRPRAWKVPFEAIVRQDDGEKIIVIRAGEAVFIPVRSGIEDTTHSEIVHGISGGEVIVLAQGKSLKPGQRVTAAAATTRE